MSIPVFCAVIVGHDGEKHGILLPRDQIDAARIRAEANPEDFTP